MRKKLATPNPDLAELSKSIEDSFDASDTKIRILVLGPDLDGDELGSRLRKYIIQKCKDDQFIVVLAEHEQIQQTYSKILGPIHDLCKMEFHLACSKDKHSGHDLIDGIIILPDSAGSLVELGMFVLQEQIHSKMLILFNNRYETTIAKSFIGKGVKKALENSRRAKTQLIDYQDLDSTWSEVSKFLEEVRGRKKWNTSLRRIHAYE